MKIGILTSSRADYGIYSPLLKKLKDDPFFNLEIIAFGTHLSEKFGYTLSEIEKDNYKMIHKIDTIPQGDSSENVSMAMGKTITNFSPFWKTNSFDLVFALGDRYEMFAAVSSSLPFNIKIAHIHGGETTLGAIDNAFRHSITHMSAIHFASAEPYKKRIIELTGNDKHVYNVGALSFDNLKNIILLSVEEFKNLYSVDLGKPTLLITFHPETVGFEKNAEYADELIATLIEIKNYQFLITMPNADTMGNLIRDKLNDFINQNENAFGFENLGTLGYLSAMKHCSFMLGNSSSGCIEASWFPKWVINLGDRQKGRIMTPNIINCDFSKAKIINAIKKVDISQIPERRNIYGTGNTSEKIVALVKQINGGL